MARDDVVVVAVGICQSQWSTSPNAAIIVGSSKTFTCQINSRKVCWTYKENISDINIIDVCVKGWDDKFIDRCNVTTQSTEGTHTLTISDVRLSDAGLYSCGDCYTTKATAHLLVLGTI